MIWESLQTALEDHSRQHLRRCRRTLQTPCRPETRVNGEPLLSFASNDYLGLANHPDLIRALQEGAEKWGAGAGASHLVSGHMEPHDVLEHSLAQWIGFDRCITFSTGYLANLAITPALVGRGDAVFDDRLNHASLIDAVQLSRAEHLRYPHRDLNVLEERLRHSCAKRKLILTDAIFSMDGDIAPLNELFKLAEQFDAWLVIDDAHGIGVLGEEGRGSLDYCGLLSTKATSISPRILLMGTLGKAGGISGAFVAGHSSVIEWLVQKARSYIFTTASPPALACAQGESVNLMKRSDHLREILRRNIRQFRTQALPICDDKGWTLVESDSAIQPIIVGDNAAAVSLAQALKEQGIWVPAIRPPTVPVGSARLRFSLSASHTTDQISRAISALSGTLCAP